MQPVDGVTDETEHRRQQRDRRGDDHRDGEHRAEREALHEREVHQEHAEQRDDDRAAGEHDRPARRRHCDLDRVLRLATRVQLGAVTGDDEERVVDARPEADHRRELGREARDVEHERDEQQPSEADAQREQRGHDRQPHRDHRAEREQQDHDRGEQTEQLARRRLGSQHLLDDVAAGLELHAGGLCRRHVAGEVVDGRLRDVARPPVELDGRCTRSGRRARSRARRPRRGSTTAVTWGSRATFASSASVRARTASACTPDRANTTIWAESPERAGNRAFSRSNACCDSTSGSLKLFVYSAPDSRPAPKTTTTASSHSTSTRHRWRTHQRARRPRPIRVEGNRDDSRDPDRRLLNESTVRADQYP